jgi:2-polyprenyl-6-methoxyphenol hydroxylase-like FAD-dependent oxidoreductase
LVESSTASIRGESIYTGTSFIETQLFEGDTHHKATAEAIGSGTLTAVAPGQGILAHRFASGNLFAVVALNKPEAWFDRRDFSNKSIGLPRVAEEFEGWGPQQTALITESYTDPVLRSIHALPVDHQWNRVPGVTLLCDAAHLLSPFPGEVANHGL